MPHLSIIIPVYNAEATVDRTIGSLACIASEFRPAVEVVVIDDGSTDRSTQLVRAAVERLPEFRWSLLTKANGGLASARNAGLRVANGNWVFFLDADDELATDLVPVLLTSDHHTCVGFPLVYHRHGRFWKTFRATRLTRRQHLVVLTRENTFAASSLVFRRDRIDMPFDESLRALEDWWFWLSNPRIFESMKIEPERVAAIIHIHDRNMSGQYARMGAGRTRVAKLVEEMYSDTLTRRQRNNLYIQREIGKLQQGMRIPGETFIRFPCDARLYLKLLIYTAAALAKMKATSYQS